MTSPRRLLFPYLSYTTLGQRGKLSFFLGRGRFPRGSQERSPQHSPNGLTFGGVEPVQSELDGFRMSAEAEGTGQPVLYGKDAGEIGVSLHLQPGVVHTVHIGGYDERTHDAVHLLR